MDLHKIAVKFFFEQPAKAELKLFVPIFHRWIQKSTLPGTLIDVADYAHLPQSPGVVLVAHEAILMIDETEGPRGLLYIRKTPLAGTLTPRCEAVLRAGLQACALLEQEPDLKGLKFKAGEAWVLSNDRLAAPNSVEAFAALQPALSEAAKAVWGGSVELVRDTRDVRTRLTLRMKRAR